MAGLKDPADSSQPCGKVLSPSLSVSKIRDKKRDRTMLFGGRKKKKELEVQLAELQRQQRQQEQLLQIASRLQREEHQRKEQQWKDEERERLKRENDQKEKDGRAQQLRDMEAKIKEQEQRRLERVKLTTPEALHGLRDLIRTKYQMDTYIWSLKAVRRPDRPRVVEMMEKADAVLMEIYTIVETWEADDSIWTPEEWRLAQMINDRIMADGKRWWENNPPWNDN